MCQGFNAPKHIDEKHLDPKFAFAQIVGEEEAESAAQINSIKKLLERKRNRSGYDDEATRTGLIFKIATYEEFVHSNDPYEYLSDYNRLTADDPESKALLQLLPKRERVDELRESFKDLKTLGRRELQLLVKSRSLLLRMERRNREKEKREAVDDKEEEEKGESELEEENERELDASIAQLEREKRRAKKKEREITNRQEKRREMSGMAGGAVAGEDDQLRFDRKMLRDLTQTGIDDLQYNGESESEDVGIQEGEGQGDMSGPEDDEEYYEEVYEGREREGRIRALEE